MPIAKWVNLQPSQRATLFKVILTPILKQSQTPVLVSREGQINAIEAEVLPKPNIVKKLKPNVLVFTSAVSVNNSHSTSDPNTDKKDSKDDLKK